MNIAYIDRQNLRIAFQSKGQFINSLRFRRFLKEKFHIDKAIIYTWYRWDKQEFYDELHSWWFEIVFREAIEKKWWLFKANIDSHLVRDAMEDFIEKKVNRAFLVSSDWDFDVLVDFWKRKWILGSVLFPDKRYTSILLKKQVPQWPFVDLFDQKDKFSTKQKDSN